MQMVSEKFSQASLQKQSITDIKKRLQHGCFPMNFVKILKRCFYPYKVYVRMILFLS